MRSISAAVVRSETSTAVASAKRFFSSGTKTRPGAPSRQPLP